ncbi:hypothetical protein CC86DRAFT_308657, partial [Ophiobolus disseminans]
RFDKLATLEHILAKPDFRYCIGPNCPSGQLHDPTNTIFKCGACRHQHCTVHNVSFHFGASCKQYDDRVRAEHQSSKDDEASSMEVRRVSVECPGVGCGAGIIKRDGCDHMTCNSRCKLEFCYICRAPYRGRDGIILRGNTAHAVSCKYHTKNLL